VTNKHADDGPWNDKKCVGIGHPSTVRSISVLLITYVSDCLTVYIQATQTAEFGVLSSADPHRFRRLPSSASSGLEIPVVTGSCLWGRQNEN